MTQTDMVNETNPASLLLDHSITFYMWLLWTTSLYSQETVLDNAEIIERVRHSLLHPTLMCLGDLVMK